MLDQLNTKKTEATDAPQYQASWPWALMIKPMRGTKAFQLVGIRQVGELPYHSDFYLINQPTKVDINAPVDPHQDVSELIKLQTQAIEAFLKDDEEEEKDNLVFSGFFGYRPWSLQNVFQHSDGLPRPVRSTFRIVLPPEWDTVWALSVVIESKREDLKIDDLLNDPELLFDSYITKRFPSGETYEDRKRMAGRDYAVGPAVFYSRIQGQEDWRCAPFNNVWEDGRLCFGDLYTPHYEYNNKLPTNGLTIPDWMEGQFQKWARSLWNDHLPRGDNDARRGWDPKPLPGRRIRIVPEFKVGTDVVTLSPLLEHFKQEINNDLTHYPDPDAYERPAPGDTV